MECDSPEARILTNITHLNLITSESWGNNDCDKWLWWFWSSGVSLPPQYAYGMNLCGYWGRTVRSCQEVCSHNVMWRGYPSRMVRSGWSRVLFQRWHSVDIRVKELRVWFSKGMEFSNVALELRLHYHWRIQRVASLSWVVFSGSSVVVYLGVKVYFEERAGRLSVQRTVYDREFSYTRRCHHGLFSELPRGLFSYERLQGIFCDGVL